RRDLTMRTTIQTRNRRETDASQRRVHSTECYANRRLLLSVGRVLRGPQNVPEQNG
ncbi:hypothetical protein BaRGS_00018546, partial [Batillaria attramentaria]